MTTPPAPSHGATIRIEGLSHRYRSRSAGRGGLVLDNINLDMVGGDRVALLGRSGCGKSTLLQIVAGLLHPTAGAVRINGTEVKRPSPRWNLMFQKPLLLPWLTVAGNVELGLRFAGRRKEAPARVSKLLDLVGMPDFARARVTELSGGQQQRVALARSLATDPDVLLLDEPFSALDPVTRGNLRGEVRAIVERLGITLLMVTHDVDDALQIASRVMVMSPHPGRIAADIALPNLADYDTAALHYAETRQTLLDQLEAGHEGGAAAANRVIDLSSSPEGMRHVPALH